MNEQEQRWIQAARGGDEAAFGELVRLLSLIHISEPTRP